MFCVNLNESDTIFLTFAQRVTFGIGLFYQRHKECNFRIKTYETLGASIYHRVYGRSIQHGRPGERGLKVIHFMRAQYFLAKEVDIILN